MLFQFYLDHVDFHEHPSYTDAEVAKKIVAFAEYMLDHLPQFFMAMRPRCQA